MIVSCTIIKKLMPAERSKQKSIIVAKTIVKEYDYSEEIAADTTSLLRYEVLIDSTTQNKINVVTYPGKTHPEWPRGTAIFIDQKTQTPLFVSFPNMMGKILDMELHSKYKKTMEQYVLTQRKRSDLYWKRSRSK